MKKTLYLAMALMLVAGLSFAQSIAPATINNDDSCDIAVTPAATLLLPHFEVDFTNPGGLNTIFTLVNTSRIPQIAHVTVWTDWSYPVLDFNVFLTGYDVQGISLYDIIGRGQIPPTGIAVSNFGNLSLLTNPHWATSAAAACNSLPGPIGGSLLNDIRTALTTGIYGTCAARVGSNNHGANAVGYVTVDVANTCSQSLPVDPLYFSTEILFDNVLTGDYERFDPRAATGNYAGGNPLVHIRAIPEGGFADGIADDGVTALNTRLPYTFYRRYTPLTDPTQDRRQPLPGVFAARYVQTATDFQTNLAIWREGVRPTAAASCATGTNWSTNGSLPTTRIVRFDEQENTTVGEGCQISPCPTEQTLTFPETSNFSVSNTTRFPADNPSTPDAGGWMYLNLNHGSSTAPYYFASQNWVVTQMTAFGRFGVDFDATYLGNGCSANPGARATIGPLPNLNGIQ